MIRRVLGIDPGTSLCGWALIVSVPPPLIVDGPRVAIGVINCRASVPVACGECGRPRKRERVGRAAALAELERQLELVVIATAPTLVACESAYVGAHASAVIAVSEARGVVAAVAARHKLVVASVAPSKHKKCATGSGRASKGDVAAALAEIYGTPGSPACYDETDALSIAHWAITEYAP